MSVHLPAVDDGDLLEHASVVQTERLHLGHDLHALRDLTEHHMLTVQPERSKQETKLADSERNKHCNPLHRFTFFCLPTTYGNMKNRDLEKLKTDTERSFLRQDILVGVPDSQTQPKGCEFEPQYLQSV